MFGLGCMKGEVMNKMLLCLYGLLSP